MEHLAPGFVKPEQLNVVSVLGALIVVGGSMLCALGSAPAPAKVAVPDEVGAGVS
jgi:hypothetical protein